MSKVYEKSGKKKKNVAEYFMFNQTEHIFCVEYAIRNSPYLINVRYLTRLDVSKQERV